MPAYQDKKDQGQTPTTEPVQAKPGAAPAPAIQMKGDTYVQQKESVSPGAGGVYQVQRDAVRPGAGKEGVHSAAAEGIAGGGSALPHLDAIQHSFGDNDVSGVNAHVGGAAADASDKMGAEAYATGNDVAFKDTPDLHTAAHEAAHVVQQRAGVQLSGGVGEQGDSYEQNADAVADRVVAGESASDLLPGGGGGGGAVQQKAAPVQKLGNKLSEEATEENAPSEDIEYGHKNERTGEWDMSKKKAEVKEYDYASGGYKTTQRRYTFGKYQEMWERERGREMTAGEISVLKRGCIGITVLNLGGSGNPPLTEAYNTFEQGHKRMLDVQKMIDDHPNMTAADLADAGIKLDLKFSGVLSQYKSVMFAKLFWSNQKAGPDQQHFNEGKHEWDEDHVWEKAALVLPNGKTLEAMVKEDGRQATIDYIYNDLGEAKFKEMTNANHQANVKAYYMAWAKAVEKKDPNAFPVDEATGKVDMSKYTEYHGRPKIEENEETGEEEYKGTYVNFDYGFWDDTSQCFWHANHCQYDPERHGKDKAEKQPMIVYQSTKDKFIKGYFDFDRVIFCVGLTGAYDPAAAALNHG